MVDLFQKSRFISSTSLFIDYGWEDINTSRMKIDIGEIHRHSKKKYCLDINESIGDCYVVKNGTRYNSFSEEAKLISNQEVLPVISMKIDGKTFNDNPLNMSAGRYSIVLEGVQIIDKKEYDAYKERMKWIDKAISEL